MKNLLTNQAHKILSLIVALAIILSGVPVTAADAYGYATSGVTASRMNEDGPDDGYATSGVTGGDSDEPEGEDGLAATPAVTAMPMAAYNGDKTLFFNASDGKFYASTVYADADSNIPANVAIAANEVSVPEATWNSGTKTLTLENASWTTTAPYALYLYGAGSAITLNLVGYNSFVSNNTDQSVAHSAGVFSTSGLTITGSGSLNAVGGNTKTTNQMPASTRSAGIFNYASGTLLKIQSGTITARSGTTYNSTGIFGGFGSMTIDGGDITATGGTGTNESCGISSDEGITINGGKLNVKGENAPNSVGFFTWAGTIELNAGIFIAAGNTKAIGGTLTFNMSDYEWWYGNNADGSDTVKATGAFNTGNYKWLRFDVSKQGSAPAQLSDISAAGNEDGSVSIEFTSDKEGMAYYIVQNSGDPPPDKPNSSGDGWLPLGDVEDGENSLDIASLSPEGKDIYIVVADDDYKVSDPIKVPLTVAPTYGISLNSSGTHTFAAAAYGYGEQTAHSVTVTNTGNRPTGNLTAALSGTNSGSFTLSPSSISSIATSGSDSFTVVPKTGLTVGTHTATVTVSGGNGISASFDVSFTVNKASYGDKTTSAEVRAGKATTNAVLTLPALPDGASYPASGAVGGTSALISTYSVTGSILKFNTTSQAAGTSATITIPVTNATKYDSYDVIVTINVRAETDAEKVADDLDALTFADIKKLNIAPNDVTTDLDLITTGTQYGSAITWTSDNTAVSASSGVVTRPATGSGNKTVNLTATITNGSASGTKSFRLTVKASPAVTGGVGGTVTDVTGQTAPGLTVKIMIGGSTNGTLVGTTITDANGVYSFTGLPYGVYSLVVDDGINTVTKLIIINAASITQDVQMPSGNQNTHVEINGGDTPSVAVENLEAMFTPSDIAAAQTGTVAIKLVVESVNNPADANMVVQSLGDKTLGFYLDAQLLKTITGTANNDVQDENIQPPSGTTLTIVVDLPQELWNLAPYSIIRVHNGIAKTISAIYDDTLHTLTFEADLFSTYAIAYTPNSSKSSSPSSGGGSPSGSGTAPAIADTYEIESAEAKTMAKEAKDKNLDYVRSGRRGTTRISKDALLILGKSGLGYRHDTVEDNTVQVRVYINDPSEATKDIAVSGYVNGDGADKAKSRFEKWFTNKVAVISLDAQGDFGMTVQIAAKVKLNGMDTSNLYFYSYDKEANKYVRILTEYKIDKNGYLHFATILAGDIIISDGALYKADEDADKPATSIEDLQNPTTGGDGTPPMQAYNYKPKTGGDFLFSIYSGEILKLEKVDAQSAGAILLIDLDAPDVLNGSQKSSRPNGMLFGGIAMALLLAAMMTLWAIIPRKDDTLVSLEEYRKKQ